MTVSITPRVSSVSETCGRCLSLALPPGGIAPGEEFYVISSGVVAFNMCRDCFDRMREEIDDE